MFGRARAWAGFPKYSTRLGKGLTNSMPPLDASPQGARSMSIGLGGEAAQASRVVGVPRGWPRPFREVVTVWAALASSGSPLPRPREAARRHSAVTRPATPRGHT
jgi:hypothetical protein